LDGSVRLCDYKVKRVMKERKVVIKLLCDYKVKRAMKERKVVIKLLGTPSSNVDGNAVVTVRGGK
jgi:hypothetical protein